MSTRRFTLALLLLGLLTTMPLSAQRRVYNLPQLEGKVTLKCDFHTHTIFSDGKVWPTVRVDEAWRDGLDVLAITDHIEYLPHKDYIPTDFNAAWKITQTYARERNIILVNGTEITRSMPPGHLNALFITDASKLDKPDFMDVIEEAISQGAFIEWNHPGWKSQEPDGIPKLYELHHKLLEKGWLHGIEFFNSTEYYPLVLKFCEEYKLTVIGNSDVHGLISEDYFKVPGAHRPMTLLFAKERSHDSAKEAMFNGETLVWSNDMIAGKEALASEFFAKSITVSKPFFRNDKNSFIEIQNHTDIPWFLINGPQGAPATITIPANSVTRVVIANTFTGKLTYDVRNILTGENRVLKTEIRY
jgi:3',5'-nucleoside bisphosphate phosphatase